MPGAVEGGVPDSGSRCGATVARDQGEIRARRLHQLRVQPGDGGRSRSRPSEWMSTGTLAGNELVDKAGGRDVHIGKPCATVGGTDCRCAQVRDAGTNVWIVG